VRGRLAALVVALLALLPATAQAAPTVVDYDLGEVQLAQDIPAFPTVPVRLQGVVAVPEVSGAAPVVVVLHGRHPYCAVDAEVEPWPCPVAERRNDLGLRSLVRALAGRGYLALAVNLNAAWTLGAGEPPNGGLGRVEEIAALHLSRLADAARGKANAFGAPLSGRADLTRLLLVGHSAGGQAAMHLARQWRKRPQPVPGRPSDGRIPVDAALLVAPTFARGAVQPQPDIPTAVVLPSCDGDVVGLDGAGYYDMARLSARRASLAATVFVRGANHNAFNAAVGVDDARLVATPGCRPGDPQRLRPAKQRQFLADYAGAFADAVFRGIVAGGLDAFVQPPGELFGARVITSLTLPSAQRRIVVEPRSRGNLRRDALGGRVATAGGARLSYCPPFKPCAAGLQQPSYPAQLRFTWPRRGGVLRLAVPKQHGDVSAYDLLALRVAVDPTAAQNAPGKAQSFSVALVDAGGRRQAVTLPAGQPALAYPIGVFRTTDGPSGHVPLGSVRVPLSSFGRIDRARVRAVEIRGDRTASGALLVANVEFADLAAAAPSGR
jgi:dienelactone hydrolase